MGVRIEIAGQFFEAASCSITEAATPLAAGDTSGEVGSFQVDIPERDPFLYEEGLLLDDLLRFPHLFQGEEIRITDSRRGTTSGTIQSVTVGDSGLLSFTCESRLGKLNIYDVQAQPFSGTLLQAFRYYASLADQVFDVNVDESIADKEVNFPGFAGELWLNLKLMAAAVDADISLVSGVILLRPIRARVMDRGVDTGRTSTSGGSRAQAVEVYRYNNRPIENELVYPPGGWSDEVAVITVNAGETIEEVVELSASVSYVQQPVAQSNVTVDYNTSSVYTVAGDDGFVIPPAQWAAAGGSVTVSINEDTTSLTVKIQAPTTPIYGQNASTPISVYSIARPAGDSNPMYSTLRLVGTGVAFDKKLIRIPTGLTASQTGTEVGITIDNPFISTLDDAYRTGTRAAQQYTGRAVSFSGSAIEVNRWGDSGSASFPDYEQVQAEYAGMTYSQVQTYLSGLTYGADKAQWYAAVANDFDNQVFGNANGARLWDGKSRRWYRVRSATIPPDVISLEADDDTTHRDFQKSFESSEWATYGDLQALVKDMSYAKVNLLGCIWGDGSTATNPYAIYPSPFLYPAEDLFPGRAD